MLDSQDLEREHTVFIDMRAGPARSRWPNRILEVTVEAARPAGLLGRKRVLDSTPLDDALDRWTPSH
ncbi:MULTISPECIES: hypothetical protein [Mycolicibacterium]|uniref:Uncharacterized protein n=2 Tax=Mycolicibacterium TaxID=1866885 RepID=G8RI62_MYCRN|nr:MULTISPECIES: hypothetical protein [Mycolicibacterium]AEV73399.1 hypothetical protein MycrhN_2831 [Mycolicibacterium rhodesiae NBB3]MBY0289339.1 hypothetical protein [Mycobacteriaceae bacterium]ORB61661.1 hypothetical protein BST47_26510 [Mycolicibacterium tusciae]